MREREGIDRPEPGWPGPGGSPPAGRARRSLARPAGVVGAAAIIGIAVFLGLPRLLAPWVEGFLGRALGATVSIAGLDPWGGLLHPTTPRVGITGLRAEYAARDGARGSSLAARNLRVRVALGALLRGRYDLPELEVEGVTISIRGTPQGPGPLAALLAPAAAAPGKGKPGPAADGPAWAVAHLAARDVTLELDAAPATGGRGAGAASEKGKEPRTGAAKGNGEREGQTQGQGEDRGQTEGRGRGQGRTGDGRSARIHADRLTLRDLALGNVAGRTSAGFATVEMGGLRVDEGVESTAPPAGSPTLLADELSLETLEVRPEAASDGSARRSIELDLGSAVVARPVWTSRQLDLADPVGSGSAPGALLAEVEAVLAPLELPAVARFRLGRLQVTDGEHRVARSTGSALATIRDASLTLRDVTLPPAASERSTVSLQARVLDSSGTVELHGTGVLASRDLSGPLDLTLVARRIPLDSISGLEAAAGRADCSSRDLHLEDARLTGHATITVDGLTASPDAALWKRAAFPLLQSVAGPSDPPLEVPVDVSLHDSASPGQEASLLAAFVDHVVLVAARSLDGELGRTLGNAGESVGDTARRAGESAQDAARRAGEQLKEGARRAVDAVSGWLDP